MLLLLCEIVRLSAIYFTRYREFVPCLSRGEGQFIVRWWESMIALMIYPKEAQKSHVSLRLWADDTLRDRVPLGSSVSPQGHRSLNKAMVQNEYYLHVLVEHHEVSELNFGGAKFRDSVKGYGSHEIWHPTKLTHYTVSMAFDDEWLVSCASLCRDLWILISVVCLCEVCCSHYYEK